MASIRSSISEKSPNYISKYRYLELKNFCLQYPDWIRQINNLNYYGSIGDGRSTDISKPTERIATIRHKLLNWTSMVEQSAIKADPDIYDWVIRSVTEGRSYSYLRADGIPCGRDYFYERYRRFFWYLDQVRG